MILTHLVLFKFFSGVSEAAIDTGADCPVDIITTMTPSETDVITTMLENVDVIARIVENVDIVTTMTPSETDVIARITENVDIITTICSV